MPPPPPAPKRSPPPPKAKKPFPFCKNTTQTSTSFFAGAGVRTGSTLGEPEYTWSVSSNTPACTNAKGNACGLGMHAFMLAISPQCVEAGKRFKLHVNGRVSSCPACLHAYEAATLS